jgi:ELWxxDGT repeat protein
MVLDIVPKNVPETGGAKLVLGGKSATTSKGKEISVILDTVSAMRAFSSRPESLVAAGERVFFRIDDGIHGDELWVSDGTSDGTKMVSDLRKGKYGSFPKPFAALGDRLLFIEDLPPVLWVTDGTPKGTQKLATLGERVDVLSGVKPVRFEDSVVFPASDSESFRATDESSKTLGGLWRTDGTRAGTRRITKRSPSGLSALGKALYFCNRSSLFRSDGVKPPQSVRAFEGSCWVVAAGERTIFITEDVGYGGAFRLWKSDGTAEGTVKLGEFEKNPSKGKSGWVMLGETLIFTASQIPEDLEIWAAR